MTDEAIAIPKIAACSTPYGIRGFAADGRAEWIAAPPACAQRLTASEVSQELGNGFNLLVHPGAQRLTASEVSQT